jgi:hypothetical protein
MTSKDRNNRLHFVVFVSFFNVFIDLFRSKSLWCLKSETF